MLGKFVARCICRSSTAFVILVVMGMKIQVSVSVSKFSIDVSNEFAVVSRD